MLAYDVIIVGAGPAGLFCAINAVSAGSRVCILEKNGSAGRKLLLTGSGRCNLTHAGDRSDFLLHYGKKGRLVKGALYAFSNVDLIAFFEKRGLRLIGDNEGRIFPESQKSGDVLRVLIDECKKLCVAVRFNRPVSGILKKTDGFEVESAGSRFAARNVVIAAGGKSYPQTGSAGDGYRLAAALGHSIVEPSPARVFRSKTGMSCCFGGTGRSNAFRATCSSPTADYRDLRS